MALNNSSDSETLEECDHSLGNNLLPNDLNKHSQTASTIALDFDYTTTAPEKSRADEIRILTIKNKKPPKGSKEQKPPGIGFPTGGYEGWDGNGSGETGESASKRETVGESGYSVQRVLGKLFPQHRNHIKNTVNMFLAEVDSSYVVKVRESDEVDVNYNNWITLRELFSLPYAIAKDGTPKNPNGIYFGHVKRFVDALNMMLFLSKFAHDIPAPARAWVDKHYDDLFSAISDLKRDGLISVSDEGLIKMIEKD